MGLLIFASVTNIVKVREGKESVATREPDLKKELKRGSMKEKWGLTLVHRSCWMVMLMMVMLMMVMMLMELKSGNTKEWGLTLIHRTGEGNRIELGVSKVGKFFS